MDIKELHYVTAIAEQKTLTRAAQKLGVSQPTLSAFLSGLEDELGSDLFFREKKMLIPSPAGKIYLEAAEKIISLKERTYLSIKRLQFHERETLRIAASPFRGSMMFASIYPKFAQLFPDTRLELREAYMDGILRAVESGEVDFGLGAFVDSENSRFDYIPLSREEIVLAAPLYYRSLLEKDKLHAAPPESSSSGHTASLPQDVSPEENSLLELIRALPAVPITRFRDAAFVLLAESTAIRSISDSIFASVGMHPPVVYESSNNLIIQNMIRQGAGVGFLPMSMVNPSLKDLCYFRLRPQYFVNLGIILKKGAEITASLRGFASLAYQGDRANPIYQPPIPSQTMESILSL